MKINLFFIITIFTLSSCATILNSKYQKIAITTKSSSDTILIDGEKPKKKKGKYLVQRDLEPKQVTIKSKGYKDENIVLMQYKKSPFLILSWIPFGILYYVPALDRGAKSFNYDKEIRIENKHKEIEKKSENAKEIRVNKVSLDLNEGDVSYQLFYSYRRFINQGKAKEVETSEKDEKIQIENTYFTHALNRILAKKGYIDTTRKVLKNSYSNNIYLNATIKNYTVQHIKNTPGIYRAGHGGIIIIEITMDWEILDYYKTTILKESTQSRSGQFAIVDYNESADVIERAIEDAIEVGLTKFMNAESLKKALTDRSQVEKEKAQAILTIPKAPTYLSDLGQAVQASLTIKTEEGFGSGFLISSDGYIITNYHVVAKPAGLNVILNDETEHEAKIVRVSKTHDLALLKIDVKDKIPFQINSSKKPQIAQEIYVVGTPTAEDLSQTISKGIISGIRKGDTGSKLIQTDASINSGNSGGPMISKDGLVLGVVSSKIKGFGVEGVAFVIPANDILDKLSIEFK